MNFRQFNLKNYAIAGLALALFATSCDKKDDPVAENQDVSLTDANAVTSTFNIPNAIVINGNPPFPSTDPNAPQLYDPATYGEDNSVATIEGGKFALDTYTENFSDVVGVYFKFKGADSYFDIPVNTSGQRRVDAGARKAENHKNRRSNVLSSSKLPHTNVYIPVPEGLQSGEICAEYCVYDADNLVSNIVEICITINDLGGAGSEFLLTNIWEGVAEREYEDGQLVDEELVGQLYTEEGTIDWLPCNEPLNYINEYRTDEIKVIFSSNGTVQATGTYYDKYVDYGSTNCETGVVYTSSTDTETQTGVWSYDQATKNLTMYFEYTYEGEVDIEVSEFKAELVNGNLLLYEEGSYFSDELQKDVLGRFEIEFKPSAN